MYLDVRKHGNINTNILFWNGGEMEVQELQYYISEIKGADLDVAVKAKARQDALVKPPESLGKLEDISVKLAGITGKIKNETSKPCVIIFSADNGVVEEGVSSAHQSVTISQTINFTKRLTGVGALAKGLNSQLMIIDVGINSHVPQDLVSDDIEDFDNNKIINRKIAWGTKNLAKGPAMSKEEVMEAISYGIEAVHTAASHGYDLLGIGEMGIGNTTTSSSILCALTGCSIETGVGRGGGIVNASFERKKEIVSKTSREAAENAGLDNGVSERKIRERFVTPKEYSKDDIEARVNSAIEVLARAGGFDICAMAGAYLAAAHERIPVVVDGFISVVAALVADFICPSSKDFMFGSHYSEEVGYNVAVKYLDLPVFLNLHMRLGEGSGCVVAFDVIKAAEAVMNNMATFEEGAINDDYLEEIRKGGCF